MGAGVSKQQIGVRVKNTKKRIAETAQSDEDHYDRLCEQSPETLNEMIKSIEMALTSYSPFPETTLLLAFRAEPERVKKALTKSTQKVLTAPIQKDEYQWFMQYVFPSTVWFKKMENGEFLYQEMMRITNLKQEKIVKNMDAVYDHLQSHSKWDAIINIENETVISRQDDEAVGLLQESGIRDVLEIKDSDDDNNDIDDLKNFIDNNLAVNILMTTAKDIDSEFQREMKTVLNRHGEFKPGPMKKVNRALSKMENDYMEEAYPKAAKLLDIARCSVSYNTVGQLLEGYNAFMNHLKSGVSSMQLARVKNGFLDGDDGGYRDIKVNVVYQSTLNPELKMITEVQFILNQYLYEKKRIHKLYSIGREQTFFDLVVREEAEVEQRRQLQFEQILNVRDDVNLQSNGTEYFKCSIDSDTGLLGMNGGSTRLTVDTFFCVDMESNALVFSHSAIGRYTHHWITINDQKYLSLQTTPNTISMFRVSDDHQFEEDESMKITLNDDDTINFCEYDQSADHVFIVKNSSILEKRAVSDSDVVMMSIGLENRIGNSISKLMALSNDGNFCVIGAAGDTSRLGGAASNFFYLISLVTQEQFKLTTSKLTNTFSPCFVNGASQFVAVGGDDGEGVEIWSVEDKQMVHHIECADDRIFVSCSYSANGTVAVGFGGGTGITCLQLYDVSTWNMIYRHQFDEMAPRNLFLTADNEYLVAGGIMNIWWREVFDLENLMMFCCVRS